MKIKKDIKKYVCFIWMLCMVTFAGCGSDTVVTNSPEPTATSIPAATPEPTTTPEPVELTAGFNEEFTITTEEKLYIGREDISIELGYLNYDEYGTWFSYILTIDSKEYNGSGFFGNYVEPSIDQEEFTLNRVCLMGADEDKSVTLLLTETTDIKEPLVLSGNAEDEYITTQPEYVETEDFILYLDEGIKVYGNTPELISTIMDLTEEETGLSLINDTIYSTYREAGGPSWLFGQETFAGVDPQVEKFHIYVVEYEKCVASAPTYSIVINPNDLEIAAREGATIIHEMVHSVHMANGIQLDRTMDEGYATYMTGRIADKDEVLTFNFDAAMNYSGYHKELTKENAEAEFCVIEEDDWEEYQYGYRFMTFLFEEYGEDVFINILNDATANAPEYAGWMESAEVATYVKKNTSETVFEEFADWYAVNKDRFEPYE